ELAQLHIKATRHLEQAAVYEEKEGHNYQRDYELASASKELKRFEDIAVSDKGSMEPFYSEDEN
ncbi:MAG: hypothetical protein BRC27_01975, partial [Nanohaloarchaea archaeon SW_10_44_10]